MYASQIIEQFNGLLISINHFLYIKDLQLYIKKGVGGGGGESFYAFDYVHIQNMRLGVGVGNA